MTRYLADVNILLALVWPRHTGHAAAQAWFAKSGHRAWATNPLTQLGVLRLLTNPAVTHGIVSTRTALELVAEATAHPGHEFWPLERDIPTVLKPLAGGLKGHQQWTDALLLVHAAERNGVLVTFDADIGKLASGKLGGRLLVLKQG
ncbi:MAG: TA system VapC family ribonuclease toxin [Bryobacteraceae bacterium]